MEKKNTRSRPSSITGSTDAENNCNTSLNGKDTHTVTIRGNHQRTCTPAIWSISITNGARYKIKGNLGQPLESSHPGTPFPTHYSLYLRPKSLVPSLLPIIPPLPLCQHVRPQPQLLRHLPARRVPPCQRCHGVSPLCH